MIQCPSWDNFRIGRHWLSGMPCPNGASFNFPQGRFQDNLAIPRASAAIIPAVVSYPLPSPDQILRIHCIKVFVRDQDRSLRFYVDQLGFRLVADTVLQSGERWLAVAPPDGDAVLALIAPKPDSKLSQLVGRPTDVVFVTDDVIARYREWSRRGVKFLSTPKLRRVKAVSETSIPPGIVAPVWGGVFTHFKDLDGNSFSLVSFDDVTRAIEAQRRAAAERDEAERRVAQELDIAKQVQARLFPQDLPVLQKLEYAGICQQARQVGGDYYDFLATGRERLCLVIGDVAGKGIGAALLMANLQANLRSQCAMGFDEPAQLMQSVNRLFCENTPENAYATFFLFRIQRSDRPLALCQLRTPAGAHCPCWRRVRTFGVYCHRTRTLPVLGMFNWRNESLRRRHSGSLYRRCH